MSELAVQADIVANGLPADRLVANEGSSPTDKLSSKTLLVLCFEVRPPLRSVCLKAGKGLELLTQ